MKKIQLNDINAIIKKSLFIDKFIGKTVMITGATGLIGGHLFKYFFMLNKTKKTNIKIICLIRNLAKIEEEFLDSGIVFKVGDIRSEIDITENVDYIFHCANPTESKFFTNNPIETIDTAYRGTFNVLEFARRKNCKSLIYLSSLEAYGINLKKDEIIKEDFLGDLSLTDVRSSYPESKRMCENLCYCFYAQHGVPVKILRLTQVMSYFNEEDNRFFASLIKSIRDRKPLVLQTKGETARPYIYIIDAISAILYTLIKGEEGQIYNVATPGTYISAYDFASLVTRKYLKQEVRLEINEKNYYLKPTFMNLDVSKLLKLGWKAEFDLEQAFNRVLQAKIND